MGCFWRYLLTVLARPAYMDPAVEEQLDYEDDEYGGSHKMQYQGGGAISALAEEEMAEDDEYDDLYNDVNVGEGFMQSMQQNEMPVPLGSARNGGLQGQKADGGPGLRVPENSGAQEVSIPGVGVGGKESNVGVPGFPDEQKKVGFSSGKALEDGRSDYPAAVSQKGRALDMALETQVGNSGFQGSASVIPNVGADPGQVPGRFVGGSSFPDQASSGARTAPPMPVNQVGTSVNRPMVNDNIVRPPVGAVENGSTVLYVGELHWWTTDAELESVLSQYGRVKEIKFYDERASGKSKGYCQVEFYDPSAAAACKEGMHGHVFNGRACVVAFASSQTLRQMGASYMQRTQQAPSQQQGRRQMNDASGRGSGMNFQGDAGRNYGRGGWGRGGQGLVNRGPTGLRGRGSVGGRGMVGNAGGVGTAATGGPYGQGLVGPALGGPTGGLMHPQGMMGAAFDPTYMGRGAAYGGFPGPAFPGMMPSFPGVNTVAVPGVAPHVNPAFFGRGMPANGMGMMGSTGMEGAGMWADPSMAGWTGDEQGRRTRESSYGGDDGASDYGYGDASHERGGRSNAPREKDTKGSERDWSGNSERRHRDDREQDWDRLDRDRDRYRDEKDGYRDHRQRERDWDNEDDWDRGQSSRSRSKSRMVQEEDHRSRSRDADYGKRRRSD
ncbi:hypothetical protein ACLOJK_009231 [Asimina triloba]